jgi:hypothetical protein
LQTAQVFSGKSALLTRFGLLPGLDISEAPPPRFI